MFYLYLGILIAVFFATFAMSINTGFWSNTLLAMNIILSGLIAFGYYGSLASLAADKGLGSYTFLLDFLSIWLLYVISFIILHRIFSGMLSKTRMRFKNPIDTIGGPVMAGVCGWLMTGLVGATLHASPFAEECFDGAFTYEDSASAITHPDWAWLNMTENLLSPNHLGNTSNTFSAADYKSDFGKQRAGLEKMESLRNQ